MGLILIEQLNTKKPNIMRVRLKYYLTGHCKNIAFVLMVVCFAFVHKVAKAQLQQTMFKTFDISKGLSNNSISVFLRDTTGFLWIGTVDGLNRYDGYSFKVYKSKSNNPNSISRNSITQLAQDYNGNIWIGAGEYLNILNPVTEKIDHVDTIFNGKLPYITETRWVLLADSLNHYWYLSSKQGVYKYLPQTDSLVQVLTPPAGIPDVDRHRLTAMAIDTAQNIWVIDYRGKLLKINNQTLAVEDSFLIGRTFDNFYKVFVDKDNHIWLWDYNSNLKGVTYINTKTRQIMPINTKTAIGLKSDIVRGITQDDKGLIWIGTDHGGISLIDKETFKVTNLYHNPLNNRSVAEDVISCFYRDYEGFIWVGTFKKGVSYYNRHLYKFKHYKISIANLNGPALNDIDNFAEDAQGNLWIGTNGAGLIYFDRKKGQYQQFKHQPHNPNSLSADVIVGLTTDRDGNLWVGTYFGGLCKYDGQKFTTYKNNPQIPGSISDDRVWDICEDKNGNLWIATLLGGVNVFNPTTGKVIKYYRWDTDSTIRSNVIYSIIQDTDGLMWFATVDGVRSLNPQTNRFTYYSHNPTDSATISSNLVFDVMQDSRGLIWAATSEGINIINKKTNKITRITEANGLPVNRVVTLLEDNYNIIWASTTNGLTSITVAETDTLCPYRIKNYDQLDGLQGVEFNEKAAFKTSKGELIFGGSNGFNLFYPDDLKPVTITNRIIFSGFEVYNKKVSNVEKLNNRYIVKADIPYTAGIKLYHSENVFTIEFSNLNYFHPERHKYQYRLVNFNNTWFDANSSQRKVTYTNLNPGKYIFQVRVADVSVNDAIKSFTIEILPPWWQTIWFRVLFVFGAVGLILLSFYLRFNQLKSNQHKLKKMVDQRTNELLELNQTLEERQEEISIQNEELEYHRSKLEKLVELRTTDLAIALKKAEESDHLKSAFLANMSHEIRTPMNAIVGFSNLLRELDLSKQEQDEYLDIILHNCQSLLVIINDILDISRIEANQLHILKTDFDLTHLFEELCQVYKMRTRPGLEIMCDKPATTEPIRIIHDEIRIKQVVQNLMDNALKFTTTGHIKFGYKLTANTLKCYVEDTGVGILPEQKHNIFKPFVKLEDNHTKYVSGAGLGLAICKRIINLMGGDIHFDSEPGKGTTFYFSIPL